MHDTPYQRTLSWYLVNLDGSRAALRFVAYINKISLTYLIFLISSGHNMWTVKMFYRAASSHEILL